MVFNLAQSEILIFHLSFNKAHDFSAEKCGPHLPFLGAVWKFHTNPVKPVFICEASSTSLSEVSKWLSSFYNSIFSTVK